MAKRGNPVMAGHGHKATLSQSVSHPVGDASNTNKGNPAKLRVPAATGATLSQSVSNPVAKRTLNKTGAKGAC